MKKLLLSMVFVCITALLLSSFVFAVNTENDSVETAAAVKLGTEVAGELTDTSTVDYYKFDVTGSGTVSIKVTTAMARTYYYLYDSSNTKIWGDRYSNGLDVKINLTAGTYYFYVGKSESVGSYTFSISLAVSNETKPESFGATLNTLASAPSITLGAVSNGHLAINDTLDYYKFTIPTSGRVNLDVTTTMGRTNYHIYNASNVKVWGDVYSNGLDQSVDLVAGTYYFYVSQYDSTGSYSFKIAFTSSNETHAESVGKTPNSIADAPVVELEKQYNGQLAINDTLDYYKITLTKSGKLNFKVITTMGKTDYYIYNSSNVKVWGDRYSNGLDQEIDLLAGTYYIYIGKYDHTGNYSLKLSVTLSNESIAESVGNVKNSIDDAPVINLGTAYNGQLAINDTVDYYKFTLPVSGKLNFNVMTMMARTDYFIYNSSNMKVWESRSSNGLNQSIDLIADTYYIYIAKYDHTGMYTLQLSSTPANESVAESFLNNNNNIGKAAAIELNKKYNGHLAINDTVDYYTFVVPSSKTLFINVVTAMGKTDYHIYNASNVKVWGDRFTGGVVEKSVELTAGTYYLYVGKVDSTGVFTFSITEKHACVGSFVTVKNPTCTEIGKKEKRCDVCGVLMDEQDIEATGHTSSEWTVSIPATCISEGEQFGFCSICGAIITETLPITDHPLGEWEITVPATCCDAGMQVKRCSGCEYYEEEEIPIMDHALGEWEIVVAPICGETGLREQRCTGCDYFLEETLDALTHIYSEWTVKTNATCHKNGMEERECTLCHHKENRTIQKLTHQYNEWTVTLTANCHRKGTEIRTCSLCNGTETRDISQLVHKFSDWEVTVIANCHKEGREEKTCSLCGDKQIKVIDQLVHQFGDWHIVKNTTCYNSGVEEKACSLCGDKETRSIEQLVHAYGDWYITQYTTCYHGGVEEQMCSLCGNKETRNIDQLSHEYSDWVVVSGNKLIPPIVKEKTCTYCLDVQRVSDWSYIWVSIVAIVVVAATGIGLVNYFKAFKRR